VICTGQSPAGAWRAAAPIVRVAGLPVRTLELLRCDDFTSRVAELLDVETDLHRRGIALADRLHPIIGTLGPGRARHDLVELRRRLHQGRVPPPRLVRTHILSDSSPGLAADVEVWTCAAGALREDLAGLDSLLEKDGTRCVEDLRTGLADPGFRRALALAGPTLLDELDKWQANPAHRPRASKVLRLVRYAARASAKTSPYSTFMRSGIAAWDEGSGQPFPDRISPDSTRSVLELDGALLARLYRFLLGHRPWSDHGRVRVSPGLRQIGDRLVFLGRPPSEPVAELPVSQAVRACLRFAGLPTPPTLADLVELLRREAPDNQGDQASAFVNQLLVIGVLDAVPPVTDDATDPLADLDRWMANADPAVKTELRQAVQCLRTLLRSGADPAERGDIVGHRQRLARISTAIDQIETQISDQKPFSPSRQLHDTAVAATTPTSPAVGEWRPALADLNVIRQFMTIFDSGLAARVALAEWFIQRWGPNGRVPFLTLLREVRAEVSRPGDVPDPADDLRLVLGPVFSRQPDLSGVRSGRLIELDRLRTQARRLIWERAEVAGSVNVNPAELAEMVRKWPSWIEGPQSVACYVQAIPADCGVGLVLNVLHGGHGRGRSRLTYHMRCAGLTAPVSIAGEYPLEQDGGSAGPLLAELAGMQGSTLNVRDSSTPYQIDYPGAASTVSAARRVPIGSLDCVLDPSSRVLRLWSPDHRSPVQPLHLGMSAEFRLPSAAAFLTRFFGTAYLVHPSASPLVQGVGEGSGGRSKGGVVAFPRVVVGRVVIQRARWFVPTGQIPARACGNGLAAHLVELLRWRRRIGLPERLFVRAWSTDAGSGQSKSRKPMYLDLSSHLLVQDFDRLISGSDFALFDEALPDPLANRPACVSSGQPASQADHVTESLIELSDSGPAVA
jgi:hypothetical protein